MRLLGAFAPNTEEGTIVGQAIAPTATAELFKNCRRLTVPPFLLLLFIIVFPFLFFTNLCHLLDFALLKKHWVAPSNLFGGGLNYQTCVFYEFVGFVRFYK